MNGDRLVAFACGRFLGRAPPSVGQRMEQLMMMLPLLFLLLFLCCLSLNHRQDRMQSVVAGQAPITLEWKIISTSGLFLFFLPWYFTKNNTQWQLEAHLVYTSDKKNKKWGPRTHVRIKVTCGTLYKPPQKSIHLFSQSARHVCRFQILLYPNHLELSPTTLFTSCGDQHYLYVRPRSDVGTARGATYIL